MKKLLIVLIFFISLNKSYSREVLWNYVCKYCTVATGTAPNLKCTNYEYELRMTTSSVGLEPGFSGFSSCSAIKHYANPGDRGNGIDGYIDSYSQSWDYVAVSSGSPQIYVSFSDAADEYCVEIPLLEYKFVLTDLIGLAQSVPSNELWAKTVTVNGTKITMEFVDSLSDTTRLSWDLQVLFELTSTTQFTVSPNPFQGEISVDIDQGILDTASHRKILIKDFSGITVAEQSITCGAILWPDVHTPTTVNTSTLSSGYYIMFLLRYNQILEYRYIIKN